MRSTARVVLVLFAALWIAPAALGQGTSGAFPDPIADRDLNRYAEDLSLSAQQRLAVDRFHELYLAESHALRDGPIQEFLDTSGNLIRTFVIAPDAAKMRRTLQDLHRLNDRLRAIDERFFDQTLTVLSEEQAAILPRVRQRRERERLLGGVVRYVTYANTGLRVDLAVVADEVELSPDDRAIIEPLLPDYEMRLTTGARRLSRETDEMFTRAVKHVEATLGPSTPGGPVRRGQAWRELRAYWSDTSEDVVKVSSDLSAMNRQAARSFASVLSAEGARKLKDEFRRRAYSGVHAGAALVIDRYDAALELPGLSTEQHKAIEAGRSALIMRHDRLAEQMIDVIEVMRRQALRRRFGGAATGEGNKLGAYQEQRREINEQALAALEALLGADLTNAVEQRMADKATSDAMNDVAKKKELSSRARSRRPTRRSYVQDVDQAPSTPTGLDPFLPGPISKPELATYRARLALADDQAAVLTSLYDVYTKSYDELRTSRIDPLVERARNMWSLDPATGKIAPPSSREIDALFDERRQVFAAIRRADTAMLDDMAIAVIAPDDAWRQEAMAGVRVARDRVAYNVGVDRATGMPLGLRRWGQALENRESLLDVALLFDAALPEPDVRERAGPILTPYERSLVELLRRRYELALEYAHALDTIRAASTTATRDRDTRDVRLKAGRSYGELSAGKGAELRDLAKRITALNRSTLDGLAEVLPGGDASALSLAYQRTANPDVFDDDGAVEPLFRLALQLEELTADQRARVGSLFADYRAEYGRLNDALMELDAGSAKEIGDRGREWQKRQQRRNMRERLEFERNELNEKTVRRLRAALGEEQVRALGLD